MDWKKTLLMDRRMNDRRFKNLPYMRWSVVLRKSLSRGSSESNSSSNWSVRREMTLAANAYLQDEAVVNVLLCHVRIEVLTLDEAQEKLVDDLNVRPRHLEDRLVLFGVEGVALRI